LSETVLTERVNCPICAADDFAVEATGADYLFGDARQTYAFARCRRCNHLYLNPRPAISEIAKIYPQEYPTFTGRFGAAAGVLARIKDSVLLRRFEGFAAGAPETMSLLDVGCGDGRFLLTLRRRYPRARLAALDWEFAPAVAAELTAAGIEMFVGTIESAALPAEHFDIISMNQLIEHVWDVPLVLRCCRDALRPGGRLAMETPNPGGWDRQFFRAGAWGSYYWPRHLNLFTRRHLSGLVQEAGMEVDFCAWLVAPPCWIYSWQFAARRAGVSAWLASRVFSDRSLLWLATFTIVDRLALLFGRETSNQKLVARRPL
jgi:SAM-dependent methyltransferase